MEAQRSIYHIYKMNCLSAALQSKKNSIPLAWPSQCSRRSYILLCSLVIHPPTQRGSDRRPYLQRPEHVSETNAEQPGGRSANVSSVGDNQNVLEVVLPPSPPSAGSLHVCGATRGWRVRVWLCACMCRARDERER